MEPIEEWLEDEMKRNGMDKKTVKVGAAKVTFGSPLGVPKDYKPPLGATAPVSADKDFKSDHHFFDMDGPVDVQSEGELYGAPQTPVRKLSPSEGNYFEGRSKEARDKEVLLVQVANVLTSIDALNKGADEEPSLKKARGAKDMVVLPHHYARFAIEPIRFAVENNLNFLQANIVKYILRFDDKNGMEDLDKAERYLTMLKRWVSKDPDWWKP